MGDALAKTVPAASGRRTSGLALKLALALALVALLARILSATGIVPLIG